MEVEPPLPGSSSNPVGSPKRFGLKSSIQTNFGDDYVFQIAAKYATSVFRINNLLHLISIGWILNVLLYRDDLASMAVSLSTNAVKLYSPVTGQYIGELRGHADTVNHMSFQVPSSPHILCSSSSDATIRFWDTRCFQQACLCLFLMSPMYTEMCNCLFNCNNIGWNSSFFSFKYFWKCRYLA